MKDENGSEMTEAEIMLGAIENLAEACACLYELESPEGKIMAFMADRLLHCINAVMHGNDPRHEDVEL